jgi:hypothetical protein
MSIPPLVQHCICKYLIELSVCLLHAGLKEKFQLPKSFLDVVG